MRRSSRFVLVISCIAVLSASAIAGAGAPPTTWSAHDLRLNLPVANDIGRYETHVAIDPLNPDVIVAGIIDLNWATDHPNEYSNIREYRSADGGTTWSDRGYLPFGDAGDPQFVFDGTGTLLAASVGVLGTAVTRSTDGGLTWSDPVTIDPDRSGTATLDPSCGFGDKEELAVDHTTGDAYIVWSHTTLECFVPAAEGDTTTIYSSRSTDHGITWSAPARISEPGSTFALAAAPAFAPDGSFHVAYFDERPIASPTDCPSEYGLVTAAIQHNTRPGMTTDTVVATSTDKGAHWSYARWNYCDATVINVAKRYTNDATYTAGMLPTMAIDPATGAILVAWNNVTTDGRYVLELLSSTDGAKTWNGPRTILSDATSDFEFPSLTAQPGRLWLQYLQMQQDGTFDYFVRESHDGGATFAEPLRLTSASSPGVSQGGTDIGDYQWIDSVPGHIVSVWTDRRDSNAQCDIYIRTATF